MERMSTGNVRLDEVLDGGLVLNSIALVVGSPGSGKTILAQQCLFANATVDRPGLYLSTVSEPFDKLLRFGQALSFFDATQIGRSVFYDDLGDVVLHDGLTGVLDRLDVLIRQHRPRLVVIDSFKALSTFATSEAEFRRFLHDLAGRLTAIDVTALWVGEYQQGEASGLPEFAIADAVIELETKRSSERIVRSLSVGKLRGSGFLSGDHLYRISADGLVVYPRLADSRDLADPPPELERRSTGIAALDDSLEEGFWPGSTTLIAGPSGSGKTLMGLHFAYAGAIRGENSLFVTFQENRSQLARVIPRFGWSIDDPHVTLMDRSPVDLYVDELIYEVLERMRAVNARRLVIDSLNDLIDAAPDPSRLREFVHSLVQRCALHNVNAMFTFETMELFRVTRISELGMSNMADNVILLQHVQDGPTMKRAMSVLKSRGSKHSATISEFHISTGGISLGDPIDIRSLSG